MVWRVITHFYHDLRSCSPWTKEWRLHGELVVLAMWPKCYLASGTVRLRSIYLPVFESTCCLVHLCIIIPANIVPLPHNLAWQAHLHSLARLAWQVHLHSKYHILLVVNSLDSQVLFCENSWYSPKSISCKWREMKRKGETCRGEIYLGYEVRKKEQIVHNTALEKYRNLSWGEKKGGRLERLDITSLKKQLNCLWNMDGKFYLLQWF